MKDSFDKFILEVFASEGGLDDRPAHEDPGGITNFGIIRYDLAEYRNLPIEKITRDDIKNLKKSEALSIYKKLYWDKIKGDSLPIGIDVCVFDFGINSGNGTAIRKLQALVGTSVDGIIGNASFRAIDNYIEKNGIKQTIEEYQNIRKIYLKSLKNFKYNPGWLPRVDRVTKSALLLIQGK
jgi:hypothetical protein